MTTYQTNQSAQLAHQALKASLQTMDQAKQCAILWFGDILERGLYRQLGYSSINQYAQIELGFSATRTGDFLSLCRKLEKLPKVREQVAIMTEFTAQTSPRGDVAPPAQIHLHQCPDCEKASVQTSKGELELSSAELERAQCDCQISEPGQPNHSTIPPTTRRRVLARDRHKCQQPGCHHTRYLEIHHKTPRSQGGTNRTDNLTTLCSACHRLLHDKGHSTARQPQACYFTRVMVRDCTDRPAVSRYT